jgi:ribosomal protein S17
MVSIRGRILTGRVVSTKMHRTIIIRREYLHYVPKYNRYEKRHKNLAAHVSPAFRVEEGDWVTVGQCRPLSKTVCEITPSNDSARYSPAAVDAEMETIIERLVIPRSETFMLTFTLIGPLQRPACPAPYRQGRQVVRQVLNVDNG